MSYAKYGTTIGEFVKRYRAEVGASQGELAHVMGVHPQYVSNVERGLYPNPVTFALLLAPHVDESRASYLRDLTEQEAASGIARKWEAARARASKRTSGRSTKSTKRVSAST